MHSFLFTLDISGVNFNQIHKWEADAFNHMLQLLEYDFWYVHGMTFNSLFPSSRSQVHDPIEWMENEKQKHTKINFK